MPHLVSTLFPALPRTEMRAFRLVLAAGALLTLALALAGLFPLALTSAALLVPILTALYLWDVDVYEDQPWRVVAMTIGMGALAGVVLGLASEAALPGAGIESRDLIVGGVVLPIASLLLALAGPVALLLPRARFNDILDGATFGAVSAAALTAAMALTRGASLLAGGLSPDGDTSEWVLRLAGLGIGMPVLAMCAAGGAAASLWARFRAPVLDRSALGPLARVRVALPFAAGLLVLGATTQVLLPGALWLAVLAVLDAIGLLWLRNAVHEGLRQQAGEQEPGPPALCRECDASTPLHAYCGNCGTARAALPKREGRRRLVPLLAVPAVVLALGLGAATAGAELAEPAPLAPPCLRGEACGRPPSPPSPLVSETRVPGGALGWSGAYDREIFELESAGADGYDLRGTSASGAAVAVRVRVTRGDRTADALAAERERTSEDVLGLVEDRDTEHRVAGPMIGYETAEVAVVTGTADTPQGPGDGFTAVIMAASDGRLTATVTISALGRNDDRRRAVMGLADVVLQGFEWGGSDTAAAPVRSRSVTASLVLRPRRPAALEARGASGRPPLTAAQIGRRYGPSRPSLQALRGAVRAVGLQPLPVAPQRTVLRVRGPRRAVERAFGVRLLAAGPGRHRPDREPRMPAAMRAHAVAVTGLDTRPLARPAAFPAGGLRPFDTRRVYGMEAAARAGVLGQGETVAVLSLDSFRDEDVAAYDRLVGIDSGPVERVPVNGGTRLGPDSEEVNLDLDVIRGLVPKAKLLNYESANRAGAFGDVMDQIVADGRAKVVSISWGRCELTLPEAERARDDAAFRAAAAAGISVFVASGDSGAYECERFDSADQRLSVSWPAASRHVVAVGGTTLRVDDDRRRESEAGWESPLSNAGAGGGVAASEPQPAWQGSSELPGVRNEASTGMRQVPDVAAASDFRTGWLAVVDGEPRAFGGTSAAAPFWAAVAVTVRQSLRAARRPLPGSFAELLYAVAARPGSEAFHDVTRGGNRFYDAGPGWDYVTGLGTPDVERLVAESLEVQRRSDP